MGVIEMINIIINICLKMYEIDGVRLWYAMFLHVITPLFD